MIEPIPKIAGFPSSPGLSRMNVEASDPGFLP